jgi:predicted HicB family RNase H-like nuclease
MEKEIKRRKPGGGRKYGSKDKTPRPSKGLSKPISLRLSPELNARIERAASLQGLTIPEYLRELLNETVPQ